MSDKEPSTAASESHKKQHREKPVTKPSLFRRRSVWVLIILFVICLVINGPFARWLVAYGLNKGLEGQDMTGQSEVSGTLLRGFTIRDLSYSGNAGIQSLKADRLAAHYKLTEIFSGKTRSLDLSGVTVIIDLEKFPAKKKTAKEPKQQLKETLTKLHGWISQPQITIADLDVSILKSGDQQARFVLSELKHQAGSNEFNLTQFAATDRENRTTPVQDVQITWEPEAAQIDRFEILPDIAVENAELDWSKDFWGQGKLQILSAHLQVTADQALTAKLINGNFDSETLSKRFGLKLPTDFSITSVDATVEKWKQPIPHWNIDAQLKLATAKYQNYQLSNTSIQITQKALEYKLTLDGSLNSNPLNIKTNGKWLSPESKQWWNHTSANYDAHIPQLGTLTELIENVPEKIQLNSTAAKATGNIDLKNNVLTKATIQGHISGIIADQTPLPLFNIEAAYQNSGQTRATVTAERNKALVLQLDTEYHLESKDYQGAIKLNEPSPDWINSLASIFESKISLDGPAAISWSGQGNAKDFKDLKIQQTGELNVEKLSLTLPDKPTLSISTKLTYQWPDSIKLPILNIRESDWLATANLSWNGKIIDISSIQLQQEDKELAALNGKIPYQKEINSPGKFLEQKDPWNLSLKSQPIALKKIHEWFKVESISKFTGTTNFNIHLSGSPSQPEIKGNANISDVKGFGQSDLLPLQMDVNFHTKNKQLFLTGNLLEGKKERFSLTGSIPFTPSILLQDRDAVDTFLKEAPIAAEVKFNTLPLGRLQHFNAELENIEGDINGTATLSGTIKNPTYLVDLDADIPTLKLAKSEIGDIRDIKINTTFSETQQMGTKMTAQINGGKFEAGGIVDLTDKQDPSFDLYLRTQYALVHRDDLMSVRANSNLRLIGKKADATLSGTIGIAESLFYKDIELIPIGVPSSEVSKVSLPALSKKKADERLPIPEPFSDWKLDLTVNTDDPFLIRGNIATGSVTGSLKVGGTLAKPAPLGTILVNKVKAKLPFSTLEIAKGEINFTPKNGLDPTLNIRGKSTVGSHDVSLFVYGSASSPKTTFTSFPPLPETDVITLIATGATTTGLEDRSTATFKAFQIFLLKLQQRNDKPGGNKLFKLLLSGVDDLNLNVGETDPFTGRKFTSAKVDVHKNWNFTAQVDDTQQTRGLVVYVFRFR